MPGAQLAIADPPYLGRSVRWYGGGRGSGRGGGADYHPDAARWDEPQAHRDLLEYLRASFDGWAIACAPDTLGVYLEYPTDIRVMVWHTRNAPPSGARVLSSWEAVVIYIPPGRRARRQGVNMADVLDVPAPRGGFAGAKPDAWTTWVMNALGATPRDSVVDLFLGSGSVSRAVAQLQTQPALF